MNAATIGLARDASVAPIEPLRRAPPSPAEITHDAHQSGGPDQDNPDTTDLVQLPDGDRQRQTHQSTDSKHQSPARQLRHHPCPTDPGKKPTTDDTKQSQHTHTARPRAPSSDPLPRQPPTPPRHDDTEVGTHSPRSDQPTEA